MALASSMRRETQFFSEEYGPLLPLFSTLIEKANMKNHSGCPWRMDDDGKLHERISRP
jgi:hypothetical protein